MPFLVLGPWRALQPTFLSMEGVHSKKQTLFITVLKRTFKTKTFKLRLCLNFSVQNAPLKRLVKRMIVCSNHTAIRYLILQSVEHFVFIMPLFFKTLTWHKQTTSNTITTVNYWQYQENPCKDSNPDLCHFRHCYVRKTKKNPSLQLPRSILTGLNCIREATGPACAVAARESQYSLPPMFASNHPAQQSISKF